MKTYLDYGTIRSPAGTGSSGEGAMVRRLLAWAQARGYQVAWGAPAVVSTAMAEIHARHEAGELDDVLYRAELASMVKAAAPLAGTVVLVAAPRPANRVRFEVEGGFLDALLPPTYVGYRAFFEQIRQEVTRDGLPGARVEHLVAPLKAVATRLGLVRYGRNNVTYVVGAGSYMQLCGFVTDAALPWDGNEAGREPALLDECEGCGACAGACPTGAIGEDRVLLCADRCLTLANEMPGEWPDWAPPWAHTCLVGCLECQQACPANPRLEVEDTGVVFSAAETRSLLEEGEAGGPNLETGIRAKLAFLGQPFMEPVLGRNLRALVEAPGHRPH